MQAQKPVTIEGVDYVVRQLPPTKALKLLSKLVRLLGVPFVTMMGVDQASGGMKDALPKALMALVMNLNDDDFAALMKELMSGVLMNNQTLDTSFESYFLGKLGAMMQLAKEVISFNYDDFFSVLAASVPSQPEQPTKIQSA